MGGYVYLIQDLDNNIYKIGVARLSCEFRLKKLQTGNPSELCLRYKHWTQYPFRLETMLHAKFRDLQIMNEWYKLSLELYTLFSETCKYFDDMINLLKENYYFGKDIK